MGRVEGKHERRPANRRRSADWRRNTNGVVGAQFQRRNGDVLLSAPRRLRACGHDDRR